MTTIASAPGKLFLSGEYAVLDGAPAICMAVDRRATVGISPTRNSTARVLAPGYTDVVGEYRKGEAGVEWLSGGDEFALVDAVLAAGSGQPLLDMSLDTSAFYDSRSGPKLGLGSSAALTVALLTAMDVGDTVLGAALDVHSNFQGGLGSGADVAVSTMGGLIEFRKGDASPSRLEWPGGMYYRLIWSGASVSTTAQLSRLAAAGEHPSRRTLSISSARVADCWRDGNAAEILACYAGYIDRLRRFSVDHDLGMFDAGHAELCDAAKQAGIVYKPCGAGGGDVGIALSNSEQRLDEFVEGQSLTVVDCALDPDGSRIEAE